MAGDFLESVPTAQAYFLKFVLHDWDDARATRILENCREALPAVGGSSSSRPSCYRTTTSRSMAKTHDVNMLVLTGGRERTLDDYHAALRGRDSSWSGWLRPERESACSKGPLISRSRRTLLDGTDRDVTAAQQR